jgi:hypothetical protein
MDQSWIEIASKVVLHLYVLIIGMAVAGFAAGKVLRRLVPGSGGGQSQPGDAHLADRWVGRTRRPSPPLIRLLVEYVGNTSLHEGRAASVIDDRRQNQAARILMNHVRREALRREASPSEVEALMERLRQAIRVQGPGPPGSAVE